MSYNLVSLRPLQLDVPTCTRMEGSHWGRRACNVKLLQPHQETVWKLRDPDDVWSQASSRAAVGDPRKRAATRPEPEGDLLRGCAGPGPEGESPDRVDRSRRMVCTGVRTVRDAGELAAALERATAVVARRRSDARRSAKLHAAK